MADQPAGGVPPQHPLTMSDDDFEPIPEVPGPTSKPVPPQVSAAVSSGPVSKRTPRRARVTIAHRQAESSL